MIREISEVLLLNLSGFLRLLDALLEHMISTVFLDIDGMIVFWCFMGRSIFLGRSWGWISCFLDFEISIPCRLHRQSFFPLKPYHSFIAISNVVKHWIPATDQRITSAHTHTKRGHSPYNCQWWWSCPITRQRLWPQAATTFWPWTSQARKSKTAHNLAFYRQKDRHVCPKTVRNATKHWLTTAVKKLRKRVS